VPRQSNARQTHTLTRARLAAQGCLTPLASEGCSTQSDEAPPVGRLRERMEWDEAAGRALAAARTGAPCLLGVIGQHCTQLVSLALSGECLKVQKENLAHLAALSSLKSLRLEALSLGNNTLHVSGGEGRLLLHPRRCAERESGPQGLRVAGRGCLCWHPHGCLPASPVLKPPLLLLPPPSPLPLSRRC
jgi:hypothetical protein